MKTKRIHWYCSFNIYMLLIIIFSLSSVNVANASEFAIFVHQSTPVKETTIADLSHLFLSETRGLGKTKLYPVNLSNEELKFTFYEMLTGMPKDNVSYHFVENELRGEGAWPREVLSELEMIKMILVSSRVIGWMPWEEYQKLAESIRNKLKLIAIDGFLPGDPDYPLVVQ